jgi:hypothetical protein
MAYLTLDTPLPEPITKILRTMSIVLLEEKEYPDVLINTSRGWIPVGGEGGEGGGIDDTALHFKGIWESNTPYIVNDLVTQGGFVWRAKTDVTSTVTPTAADASTPVAVPNWSPATAIRAALGVNSFAAVTATKWWYLDVSVAGTLTVSNNTTGGNQRNTIYDSTANNLLGYGGDGGVATANIGPGRYFCGTGPFSAGSTTQATFAASGGLQVSGESPWEKMWAIPT